MKHKKLLPALTAFFLSFCLIYGGLAAMVTGTGLSAELPALGLWCALTIGVVVALFHLPRGSWICLAALVLCLGVLALSKEFRDQVLAAAAHIFTFYHHGYGFEIPPILAEAEALTHLPPLVALCAVEAFFLAWAFLRSCPVSLGLFLSALPLAVCFVVNDTVPEAWTVCVWLTGLVLALLTHPVRLRDRYQGDRLARLLAIPTAAAVLLLSLWVSPATYQPPQIALGGMDDLLVWLRDMLPLPDNYPDIDLGETYFIGGFQPDQVTLDRLGTRVDSSAPVMEVTSTAGGTLYLRGRDYDRYTGSSWQGDTGRLEPNATLPDRYATRGPDLEIRLLDQTDPQYLPYYPPSTMTIRDGLAPRWGNTHHYEMRVLRQDWQSLWRDRANGNDTQADERYLQLPDDTRQEGRKLLEQILSGQDLTDELSMAQAIGRYVRGCARYDKVPSRMPDDQEDFAIWFLTRADAGYCVHFATAATVLLRCAGIPARYVEGFTADVQSGRTTKITQESAHAWVEYYLPGLGWVILEATPGAGGPTPIGPTEPADPTEPSQTTQPSQTTEPSQTTQPEDTTVPSESTQPSEPTEPSEETDPSQQTQLTDPSRTTGPADVTDPTDPEEPGQGLIDALKGILLLLACICAVIAALAAQWLLRRRHRQKRCRGRPDRQALSDYRLARRLARWTKTPLPRELSALAEKAAYSHHRLQPEELGQIQSFVTGCLEKTRGQSRPRCLLYRLALAI